MFKTAVFRLTAWYLALVLLLSTGFSMALYQVSTRELNADEQRLQSLLQRSFFQGRMRDFTEFNIARLNQIESSRDRIKLNLLYFNLVILVGGGAASYFLARRTLRPIEENVEAQTRFTSDASHELRTPLTAMKSEIEVALRDKNLSLDESKALHRSTLEEIGRLEALSSGLLQLARQERQDYVKSFSMVPLSEVIQEAVAKVEKTAKQRRIVISAESGEERVEGDRWSLVELVSVLLDNAIKYSPEGAAVKVEGFSKFHNRQTGISVTDTGTGIKPDDLPRIFDRFYRTDLSRTQSAVQGYGLGLSIAKKIADAHRGSIEVRSRVGEGSTFTVLLPTHQPATPLFNL